MQINKYVANDRASIRFRGEELLGAAEADWSLEWGGAGALFQAGPVKPTCFDQRTIFHGQILPLASEKKPWRETLMRNTPSHP
ncbi:hypothetical protein ACOSP7_029160 [Xanthoceras sorbifolium]